GRSAVSRKERSMSNAPFPIDPELTAIAIAYRNGRMIADEVLPRVPVGKQEFKFWKYDLAQGFTVPETLVGRCGRRWRSPSVRDRWEMVHC
ncbi:hypothetical protein ACV373_31930, partial [Pseudomonas aeruginosa]